MFAIFVIVATVTTITFGIWYSGYLEERGCIKSGGTWVAVRKMCFRQ